MSNDLTKTEYNILILLGRYKYLTPKLLIMAGCIGKYSYVEKKCLPKLSENTRPYILKKDNTNKKEGEEYIYALSERGAKYISERESIDIEKIHHVKGRVIKVGHTINHILKCAEFQAIFNVWIKDREGNIELYQTDLDKIKRVRERKNGFDLIPKNRIYITKDRKIEPDAVIKYKVNKNLILVALEIEIDKNKHDVVEAVKNHMLSLKHSYISKKFDHNKAAFILYVFDKPGQLKNVKKDALHLEDFDKFKHLFIFNTIEQIQKDFCQGWHLADNQEILIFKRIGKI